VRRFLVSLLSLTALAIPTGLWGATSTSGNLAINVTPGQSIAAINLSNNTFAGSAPSGTVVGAISVTMSPSSPGFSGSLSLNGTNASQFQISGSNLVTNGVVPAGTYHVDIVATETGVGSSPFTQAATLSGTSPAPVGVEVPGPSLALFNNPYYTCVRNFYVATNGSDSNNGTSPSTPWRTIAHADTASRTGGDCINIAAGAYANFNENLSHGGTTASSTGYVVYRCTTMNACTITNAYKTICAGANCSGAYPNYLIFDGFTFSSNAPTTAFASAVTCINANTGTIANGCHHWFIINNIVNGYGQSGVQHGDTEYWYTVHNTIFNNSHSCTAAQGSGISYVTPKPVPGYSPTADDLSNPKMGVYGTNNPFHLMAEWNVIYNNYVCKTNSGANTDGNGIIMDSFDKDNGNPISYPYQSLLAFNVVYNNGGGGIRVYSSSNVTVANNSVYHNYLDPNMSGGSGRGSTSVQRGGGGSYNGPTVGNNILLNNVSTDIYETAPPLQNNGAYLVGGDGQDAAYNNPGHNIGFHTGSVTEEQTYNGNPAWNCSANKCATNPLWVNVGNTSVGDETTPPVGTNFALQSGSPAIGYGLTANYLPAQSVDAGACYHTLASCP